MSALIVKGNASGTGATTLQSANTASSTTFTLPGVDGTSGQFLSTDGSGNLTFTSSGGGTGTVTTVSVVSANGLAGTVATATTTPAITLSTSITGVLKGNGTAISAATAGTDYVAPGTATTFTAAQTFNSTYLKLAGSTSGTSTLNAQAVAGTTTYTLPPAAGTLGYVNAPQTSGGASAYTLVLADQGNHVIFTGGSTATLTVPTNATVAFPIGTTILVVNDNSGNLTISGAGVTFQLANGATGNRTVATKGLATCLKTATDTWYVSGAGVT